MKISELTIESKFEGKFGNLLLKRITKPFKTKWMNERDFYSFVTGLHMED